jgi:peroxiredoxin Q/BCP
MIDVGQRAPEFTLPAGDGRSVSLADFRGKKVTVLFFYPKDDTPGCTREACEFRDSFDAFGDAGAEVIGVSDDDVESHKKFAANHRLQMTLLSDLGGKVREKFGVKPFLGIVPDRVTFVIDREGVVRHVFAARLRFGKHVDEALAVVKSLASGGSGKSATA